jgi:hypothetical protein
MNHSIGVTMKFAGFAAGGSDHPRTPPGDLVGRDHRVALRSATAAARSAWASADMARPCHLPFGTFPAGLAAGINLFDVLAHTWDIAAATGVSSRRLAEQAPAGRSPGSGGWAVAMDDLGLVLVPGCSRAIRVQDHGPAPLVNDNLVVKETK